MKIQCAFTEMVDVVRLQPNPKNPNKHPDKQIEMLAKIIAYQGQRSPIVVSKRSGFIVKGHGRLEAIKKLGWEMAAVDFQEYESEAQEFADMVADNKIAELSEHDNEMMKNGFFELELDRGNFDIQLLGVDDIRFLIPENIEMDKKLKKDLEKKFVLEIEFPNEMELKDAHDDFLSRGFIVRIKSV